MASAVAPNLNGSVLKLRGFGLSAVLGVLVAVLLASSRMVERALYPYTLFLQTVPIVAIAPLLWRLDYYGIELSKNAAPLLKYAERIFSRPAYIEALTPSEKVMRK